MYKVDVLKTYSIHLLLFLHSNYVEVGIVILYYNNIILILEVPLSIFLFFSLLLFTESIFVRQFDLNDAKHSIKRIRSRYILEALSMAAYSYQIKILENLL